MQEKKALSSWRRGRFWGFLELRRPWGFSHETRWGSKGVCMRRHGSQVSLRVARVSTSWPSSHGRGLGPRDALKKDSRGLSRGAAGNPRFPRLLPGTWGNFPGCLWEARDPVELAGPLGTPLGLAQWKRASSRGEAGTSGFLSVSDSDRRVPAELGQESQA